MEPEGDRAQHDCAPVGDRQLVVAGGQCAPVLGDVEGAFDDVAALVVLGVEVRGSSAGAPASSAVGGLVVLLRDHRGDAPGPQVLADGPGGVCLVPAQLLRAGPGPAGPTPVHLQVGHEGGEHRGVPALARSHQHHHRPPGPVDQGVDLGGEPSAGAAHGVVSGLEQRIRVVRPVPLCGGRGWWRAGGRG